MVYEILYIHSLMYLCVRIYLSHKTGHTKDFQSDPHSKKEKWTLRILKATGRLVTSTSALIAQFVNYIHFCKKCKI